MLEDDRAALIDDVLVSIREGSVVHVPDNQLGFLELLLKKEKVKQILAVLARRTLQSLRRNYHYVVTDTSAQLDDVTLTTLELSDLVLLVCTPDVASVRATRAAMTLLDELGVGRDNVAYVLNRSSRRSEIRADDVRSLFTGYEMLGEIPADFSGLQPFVNTGALIAGSGREIPLTRALDKLAVRITEQMPVARAA